MTIPPLPPYNEHKTYPGDSSFPNKSREGLTKREYFAAMAMQGLSSMENKSGKATTLEDAIAEMCQLSVMIADALIKALNENQP